MKPVIGVTLCLDPGRRWRPGRDYVYLSRAYLTALSQAGGIPLALGPDTEPADCADLCRGLVISGGGDLPRSFDPDDTRAFDPAGEAEVLERTAWERALIDEFCARQRPILGVCYGMQLLGLHFGGTLFQNLHEEVPGASDHGAQARATEHQVIRHGSSWLLDGLEQRTLTNSSHLQAIDVLPPGVHVTATSEDGVVEAFESTASGVSLAGVQWHPESDATARQVYGNFVTRVAETGAER